MHLSARGHTIPPGTVQLPARHGEPSAAATPYRLTRNGGEERWIFVPASYRKAWRGARRAGSTKLDFFSWLRRKRLRYLDDPFDPEISARERGTGRTGLLMLEPRRWEEIEDARSKLLCKIWNLKETGRKSKGKFVLVLSSQHDPPEWVKKALKRDRVRLER